VPLQEGDEPLQKAHPHKLSEKTKATIGAVGSQSARRSFSRSDAATLNNKPMAGVSEVRHASSHCHYSLGKLYRRTGKREQARDDLTTATTMYREMDMRFYLEQMEAAMRELE